MESYSNALSRHKYPSVFLTLLGDITLCQAGSERYQTLLANQPLDVAIDLSGQPPLPEIIAWAKYGVWRHFHGEPADLRDDYVGIQEYAHRQDEIISGIESLSWLVKLS